MASRTMDHGGEAGRETTARMEQSARGFASPKEAEKFLSVGRSKLYGLMDAGQLDYAKFGKCRRIPWRALRESASAHMVD